MGIGENLTITGVNSVKELISTVNGKITPQIETITQNFLLHYLLGR